MIKEKNLSRKVLTVFLSIAILTGFFVGACFECSFALSIEKKKPKIDSGAAATLCADTGKIIYSKKGKKRIQPYSTTKVLTAYLAAKKLPPNKVVTVSKKAAEIGGSSIWLEKGEKIKVIDLMYGLMLYSGNDAAYALAEEISGSVKEFSALMNETVKSIDCNDTHFVNPNGFADPRHYSTAEDMAKITALAVSDKTVRKIMGTGYYKIEKTNKNDERFLSNGCPFIRVDRNNILAAKTGYWAGSDCSLVYMYEYSGLTFVSSLMRSNYGTRFQDALEVKDYTKELMENKKIIDKKVFVQDTIVNEGAKRKVKTVTGGDFSAKLPKGTEIKEIEKKVNINENLTAPVYEGQVIGSYRFYAGKHKLGEVPLLASATVKKGWFLRKLGFTNLEIILLIAATIFALIIAAKYRYIYRKKLKMKRKKEIIRKLAEDELRKEGKLH